VLNKPDLDYLKQVSIFAALEEDALKLIGECAVRVEVEANKLLFREGELAREMVIVLSGKLEVFKTGRNDREARIAVLGPGDVVGEMSLVDIQPRSAGVRAMENATIATFSHGDIAKVYREDPQAYTLLVLNIAREISIRLRRMDNMLANLITEIADVTSTRLLRGVKDRER
jgi:CRP-like cAMP-binding protein